MKFLLLKTFTFDFDEIYISSLSYVSATSFFKAQPVIDFAVEYLNLHDTSRRLSDQDRIKVWTI